VPVYYAASLLDLVFDGVQELFLKSQRVISIMIMIIAIIIKPKPKPTEPFFSLSLSKLNLFFLLFLFLSYSSPQEGDIERHTQDR